MGFKLRGILDLEKMVCNFGLTQKNHKQVLLEVEIDNFLAFVVL